MTTSSSKRLTGGARVCDPQRLEISHGAAGHRPALRLLAQAAFSLVEIMVVMGLLTVIILGLLLMFNQTQRAFRTGMTQVDVLENGRTITEMLARELSQMTPQSYARTSNTLNFYVVLPNYAPLLQPLPGGNGERRTNLLEELFFTRRENHDGADGWTGTGYFVRTNDGSGSLGFPGLVGSFVPF
jgi:hypothetical protein